MSLHIIRLALYMILEQQISLRVLESYDEVDTNLVSLSSSKISPSIKRPTSLTPSPVFSKRTKAGTLLTFHWVLKTFLGSFHLRTIISEFDNEQKNVASLTLAFDPRQQKRPEVYSLQ
jgi:hypothetical protein